MKHSKNNRTENWFSRLKYNGFFQIAIGFLCYLFVAAVVMYLFESAETESGFISFFQSLWFTIVTATTVGYGDISPLSTIGKVAAVIIMFIGIGYTGILTAGITSWLVEKNQRKAQGFVSIKKKKGHFLIFGWRADMADLLKDILELHQKTSKNLVLVNNVHVTKINELRQDPILRDLYFFRGDHTNADTLNSICAQTADKVLILSDENATDSPDEIDFKTVLSAKAVERINPTIFTTAEIIQPHFEVSLRKSNIEEVILNRYMSRSIISNVALMAGLNNIIQSIFDINDGVLRIKKLDQCWVGRPYQELKEQGSNGLVIGVLENVGDLQLLKNEKMEQVQKSVSIQCAIQGLVELKKMKNHQPVLHPSPNFIIKENSALIVLDIDPGELNNWYKYNLQEIEESKGKVGKEHLKIKISKALEVTHTYPQLDALLRDNGVELYHYGEKISGIIVQNQKYTFETLDVSMSFINQINALYIEENRSTDKRDKTKVSFLEEKSSNQPNLDETTVSKGGQASPEKLNLLFCGWRNLLPDMIRFIMSESHKHNINWTAITVVADVSAEQFELFNTHFQNVSEVKLIRGDFTNRQVLLRAGIQKANRVIVLAELDSNRTTHDIDARSVLTGMALADLNKYAYKVVEVLDHKYKETLQYSDIEEVIPVDYFSRILLSTGFYGQGTANVFQTMVNLEQSCFKLEKIEDRHTGRSFSSYLSEIHSSQKMVLGLVEETGNIFVRKSNAIHKAQFEPAIENSVAELKKVKDISANKVILGPSGDYKIKSSSRLILIESNDHEGWCNYLRLFT